MADEFDQAALLIACDFLEEHGFGERAGVLRELVRREACQRLVMAQMEFLGLAPRPHG